MAEPERYSDKRLADSFTAYVLFSDRLEATGQEVLDAAAEDYPEIEWPKDMIYPGSIDTRGVSMMAAFDMPDTGHLSVAGMAGPLGLAPDLYADIAQKSALTTGKDVAERILLTHTDHLSISVGSRKDDTSVAARFAAARKMACFAGVLAKLPTAVGVYFPSCDMVLTPDRWLKGVECARKGELPLGEWLSTVWTFAGEQNGREYWSASTIGLAAFNGHELNVPRAPAELAVIGTTLGAVARMLVEADHVFRDSDKVSGEDEPMAWRIRHMAENPNGTPQTDLWVLLHPEADVDEEAVFGPRPLPPAPEGVDNKFRGDWSTLRSDLNAMVGRQIH